MNFIQNVASAMWAVIVFAVKAIVWVAVATWAVITFPFRAFAWIVEKVWSAVVFAGKTIVAVAVMGAVALMIVGAFGAIEMMNAIAG